MTSSSADANRILLSCGRLSHVVITHSSIVVIAVQVADLHAAVAIQQAAVAAAPAFHLAAVVAAVVGDVVGLAQPGEDLLVHVAELHAAVRADKGVAHGLVWWSARIGLG